MSWHCIAQEHAAAATAPPPARRARIAPWSKGPAVPCTWPSQCQWLVQYMLIEEEFIKSQNVITRARTAARPGAGVRAGQARAPAAARAQTGLQAARQGIKAPARLDQT